MNGLNPEQQAAVNCGEGVFQVLAGPGSGKTKTLVARHNRLWDLEYNVLSLTFTRSAAQEMAERAGGGNFRTIGSLAFSILRTPPVEVCDFVAEALKLPNAFWPEFDYVQVDESQDCSVEDWEFIRRLSPNILAVGDAMQCVFSFRSSKPDLFLNMPNIFPNCQTLLLGKNYRCHPPGTKITCCIKRGHGATKCLVEEVPIEQIQPNYRAIPYRIRHSSGKFGFILRGRTTELFSRPYIGKLLSIKTENHEVCLTPNHKVYVKFNENAVGKWIVYLMWRPDRGFRIGQCALISVSGRKNPVNVVRFWHRLYLQKPEKVWLLAVVDNRKEGRKKECVLSATYGILQTEFFPSGPGGTKGFSVSDVAQIYSEVPQSGGFRCLEDSGLLFDEPLLTNRRIVIKNYVLTAACNVFPTVMSVPTKERPLFATGEKVLSVTQRDYDGPVYALSVDTDHNYVADGIVVGNSTKSIVRFCKSIAPIRGDLMERMCTDNEEGEPVEFLSSDNNVAEAEGVLKIASKLEGRTAILARTNKQLDIFRKLEVVPCLYDLMTVHRAKGGEWSNVFLVGAQEGLLPIKNGDLDEEARILFVAASRAKKRLFISSYGTRSSLL